MPREVCNKAVKFCVNYQESPSGFPLVSLSRSRHFSRTVYSGGHQRLPWCNTCFSPRFLELVQDLQRSCSRPFLISRRNLFFVCRAHAPPEFVSAKGAIFTWWTCQPVPKKTCIHRQSSFQRRRRLWPSGSTALQTHNDIFIISLKNPEKYANLCRNNHRRRFYQASQAPGQLVRTDTWHHKPQRAGGDP